MSTTPTQEQEDDHEGLVTHVVNSDEIDPAAEPITSYAYLVAFVLSLSGFMYGLHIGELNAPQDVITTCPGVDPKGPRGYLPPCLPMTPAAFSLTVSVFTIGGLLGSLLSGGIAESIGRKKAVYLTNLMYFLGSVIETFSTSPFELYVGRTFAGIGSGATVVVIPMYLSEIAPLIHRGFFGTLNQIGVVSGITVIQLLGMYLSTIPGWRSILAFSIFPSVLQFILLPFCVESPPYLATRGRIGEARAALEKLRGSRSRLVDRELSGYRGVAATNTEEDLEALMSSSSAAAGGEANETADENGGGGERRRAGGGAAASAGKFTLRRLLTSTEYRRPVAIMMMVQLGQQLSGINAVMYYSTSIMSAVLPGAGALIAVLISLVNMLMTFPSVYLIDRAGRRPLFVGSAGVMTFATVVLALAMAKGYDSLSAVAILLYVASFSIGLGPIPFMIISELFDARAVGVAASTGLVVNWITNFLVGTSFLPLSAAIGSPAVFAFFAMALAVTTIFAVKILPETKGKTAEEVRREYY